MTMIFDLTGKRALVTGASSGLGAHFARVLSRAGAHVILAARRLDAVEAVAASMTEANARLTPLRMDVTDETSIRDAFDRAGRVDILVNNAGITHTRPVLDETLADIDDIFRTNLRGTMLVAIEASRRMKSAARSGAIINIASILGIRQGGQVSAYAISKAGVIQMTKQLALELARFDIRVNALAPGYFATDLNRDFFESEAGQALIRRVPFRRLGQLDDLNGPLLLLASDASKFMSGSILTVDGGHAVSSL